MLLWVLTPCGLEGDTKILEDHAASMLRVEGSPEGEVITFSFAKRLYTSNLCIETYKLTV
jgi:hypothetical protein